MVAEAAEVVQEPQVKKQVIHKLTKVVQHGKQQVLVVMVDSLLILQDTEQIHLMQLLEQEDILEVVLEEQEEKLRALVLQE
jgi:hypothetical protein